VYAIRAIAKADDAESPSDVPQLLILRLQPVGRLDKAVRAKHDTGFSDSGHDQSHVVNRGGWVVASLFVRRA